MKHLSLSAKMTSVVALIIAVTLSIISLLVFRYFENEFRKTIAQHQYSMISAVAEQLDSKLQLAQHQIVAVAQALDPVYAQDTESAESYLRSQVAGLETFDNGLSLFSESGTLIAGTKVEQHMRGRDFSSREYFKETVRTRQSHISKPFISVQKHGHPIIMVTAPIVDHQGNLAGILVGSLDLSEKNILGSLADCRVGQNGCVYLFNQDGILLFHPNREKIFSQIIPEDADPLLKRVSSGFEGSGEYIDAQGTHLLSSFKRLKSTGWVLAVDFPRNEAYAPLARAQRYFLSGIGWFLVLSMLTIHFFAKHLTRPLGQITERARLVSQGITGLPPLQIAVHDEIGVLAEAFNQMLARLEGQTQTIYEQKEFAETLLRNSASPVFVINDEHHVIAWNRACEELTGVPAEQIMGTDRHWHVFYEEKRHCLADIVIDGDFENLASHYEPHFGAAFSHGCLQAEGWLTIRGKGPRYLIFRAVPIRNNQGKVIAAIQTLEDYTDRAEAEKKMRHLAHFDHLTGLPNRALLFDRLSQGLNEASRYQQALALFFLDLNGFKQINDSLGHDVGDKALVEVACRLQSCVRDCDTVARMGGDEFTVILTRVTGVEDAVDIAKRILGTLGNPLFLEDQSFILGASIGISIYPEHGSDANTLVKNADTAMYDVKAEGKNQYRVFGQKLVVVQGKGFDEDSAKV